MRGWYVVGRGGERDAGLAGRGADVAVVRTRVLSWRRVRREVGVGVDILLCYNSSRGLVGREVCCVVFALSGMNSGLKSINGIQPTLILTVLRRYTYLPPSPYSTQA